MTLFHKMVFPIEFISTVATFGNIYNCRHSRFLCSTKRQEGSSSSALSMVSIWIFSVSIRYLYIFLGWHQENFLTLSLSSIVFQGCLALSIALPTELSRASWQLPLQQPYLIVVMMAILLLRNLKEIHDRSLPIQGFRFLIGLFALKKFFLGSPYVIAA